MRYYTAKHLQISSASVCKSVATTVDSTVQQWKAIVQEIWKAGTRMRGKVRTTRVLLGHHSTLHNLCDYETSSDRHDDRIYPQQMNNATYLSGRHFSSLLHVTNLSYVGLCYDQ